ncbi:MAG: iron ABC transporter permease [Bacteroidota bacterium]
MEFTENIKSSSLFLKLSLLLLLLLVSAMISLVSGSTDIGLNEVLNIFFTSESNETLTKIILDIRLPRILLAIGVGGGLSIAGAVFQSLLMNPLADPYILGVSSGGSFGAVLALFLGLSFIGVQLFSFIGAAAVILLVFMIGHKYGRLQQNILLLAGVMIGAFFAALILLIVTLMNDTLRTAIFWLVGNLSMADTFSAYYVLIASITISIGLVLNSHKLNLLAMGDEDAYNLGLNQKMITTLIYLFASLLVGIMVSVSGVIGFVGLLIPHITRLIFGADNRIVLPASFLIGASFLILTDTLARTIVAPTELPVGALTAIIGAPIFIYLLKTRSSYN